MEVDVLMCTWNSNKSYFVKCLNSIKREVPIHHFILVDRFSTDGTVQTVRQVFPSAKVIESDARLAFSRKLGIELVDTKFFVLVDSDIELFNGWFKRIMNYLDSGTGAIEGSWEGALEHVKAWGDWLQKILARFQEAYRGEVIVTTAKNQRTLTCITSNTLIRTCLVKDWNPPAIISACEDHLLLRHVVRKGYAWKALRVPSAIHYQSACINDELRKGRWVAAGSRLLKWKHMSIWWEIRKSLILITCALFASLQTKQPMILPYVTVHQLGWIQGWVNWNKYLELKR